MDLNLIKSVVAKELSEKSTVDSLKLQNHLYGCFLIMEDISEQKVDYENNTISTNAFQLDLDKQFSEIGLRYGFVMDTKLILNDYSPEYKETWLKYFKDIDIAHNIDEVDKVEDTLIKVIQEIIKPDDAFFIHALESGTLAQEWIDKLLKLLNPVVTAEEVEIPKTQLTKAQTEKPIKRRLSTTRRNVTKVVTPSKKNLAKTRRHH